MPTNADIINPGELQPLMCIIMEKMNNRMRIPFVNKSVDTSHRDPICSKCAIKTLRNKSPYNRYSYTEKMMIYRHTQLSQCNVVNSKLARSTFRKRTNVFNSYKMLITTYRSIIADCTDRNYRWVCTNDRLEFRKSTRTN